jgi:hypothetical protein
MKQFTFDDLPNIIGKLYSKLNKIEKLLKAKKALMQMKMKIF